MVLHSQTRAVIYKLMKFMDNEATNGLSIPLSRVMERVAAATGISKNCLTQIKNEGAAVERGEKSFSTPNKKRKRVCPVTNVDVHSEDFFRRHIYRYHKIHKEHPTLDRLMVSMKKDGLPFQGSRSSLATVLRRLGFRYVQSKIRFLYMYLKARYRWRKSTDNRKMLTEKLEIRQRRVEYIRRVQQYRAEGRPIVYIDETYINSNHTKPHAWLDGTSQSLHAPIGKGRRLIIINGLAETGFIPNALLMFKSGSKSGDYHADMNNVNYMKWLQEKLIPNLPPKSVIVVDNASYHNVSVEKNITFSQKKEEMQQWLDARSIPYQLTMTKVELYELIKPNKSKTKTYKSDVLLSMYGHTTLRLPPYHPELNPIEKMWAIVKNWVADKNVSFKLDDVQNLAKEKFNADYSETAKQLFVTVQKTEEEFIQREHFLDVHVDDLIINFDDDSDSDESQKQSDDDDLECAPL